jgi:Ankyrin repeats (3 copies)/Ankyrin repeats (many copies)
MATKKFNKVAFTFLCITLSSAYGMQEFTALHEAAREGNLQLVQSLVNSGVVGINTRAGFLEHTPLYCAAGKGHLEVVQWLLENKADVNACSWRDRTALFWAARSGHMAVAQCLINYGANINAQGRLGQTALMNAEQLDIVQLLIDNNSDINAADRCGYTALHRAVLFNKSDLVKVLVQNGANVTIRKHNGETALDAAISNHNDEAKNILESYSKLEQETATEPTDKLFKQAIQEGYYGLVKHIVESYKINVTKEDIALAKAMWQKTNEAIYKKIGRLLIISYDLLEKVRTSQSNAYLPKDMIGLIHSFVVEEKSF